MAPACVCHGHSSPTAQRGLSTTSCAASLLGCTQRSQSAGVQRCSAACLSKPGLPGDASWPQRACVVVTAAQQLSVGSIPRHAQPVRWPALSAGSPLGCRYAQLPVCLSASCQGMRHGPSVPVSWSQQPNSSAWAQYHVMRSQSAGVHSAQSVRWRAEMLSCMSI